MISFKLKEDMELEVDKFQYQAAIMEQTLIETITKPSNTMDLD